MRRRLGLIVMGVCLTAGSIRAEDAQTKLWELTDYLKGTPAQIRAVLYKEIIRLTRANRETRRELAEAQSDLTRDNAAALDRAHGRTDCAALMRALPQAKAELDHARSGGTTAERMAASSKYNRIREGIDSIERSELRNDRQIPADQKRIADLTSQVSEQQKSLDKAEEWKNKIVNAIEFSFRLQWPLKPGDRGLLGDVVVRDVISSDSFTCNYDAFETLQEGHNAEGIVDVHGISHTIGLVVQGVDTDALKTGSTINLDKTFELTRKKDVGGETFYVVHRSPGTEDYLWDRVTAGVSDVELAASAAK